MTKRAQSIVHQPLQSLNNDHICMQAYRNCTNYCGRGQNDRPCAFWNGWCSAEGFPMFLPTVLPSKFCGRCMLFNRDYIQLLYIVPSHTWVTRENDNGRNVGATLVDELLCASRLWNHMNVVQNEAQTCQSGIPLFKNLWRRRAKVTHLATLLTVNLAPLIEAYKHLRHLEKHEKHTKCKYEGNDFVTDKHCCPWAQHRSLGGIPRICSKTVLRYNSGATLLIHWQLGTSCKRVCWARKDILVMSK